MLQSHSSRQFISVCSTCRTLLSRSKRRCYSSTTTISPEIYDVVTIGGGPVGLALLAAIKSSPVTSHLRCALIESQDLAKSQSWHLPSELYSNRASSLTPTNVSFLEQIGAWKHVNQDRVQAYDEMQVWDASNDATIQFDWKAEATKYNAPLRTIATMMENANLTKGLLDHIAEMGAQDSVLSNTTVSSIENGQDEPDGYDLSTWPVVTLNSIQSATSSRSIAARLLIGADGFNSPVRNFAGISSHGWDYDRHGVVATLKVQHNEPSTFTDPNSFDSYFGDTDATTPMNRATAYQRFLPSVGGPIAVLPLPDNHASLVWSTTPRIASYLKTLSPEAFVATANAALRLSQTDINYLVQLQPSSKITTTPSSITQHEDELLWRLKHTPPSPIQSLPQVISVQDKSIASFPLRFRHAKSLIAPRVALAGDAAHTIHPLAGQGLNLGLHDVASLSSTISYAVQHGQDIGDLMTLERYGSARFGAGLKMAGGVDALNWIYQLGSKGGDDSLVGALTSQARGIGMKVFNQFGWAKGTVMSQAD